MKKLLLGLLLSVGLSFGQTNLIAGGVSYAPGASPSTAFTGMYAHLVTGSNTYAFTVTDAIPIKPVNANVQFQGNTAIGVAQKLFTIGKVDIYMPVAAGFSWTGSNQGWDWTGGVMAPISVRGNLKVMPNLRYSKSSVSGGVGYQIITGVMFAWGF